MDIKYTSLTGDTKTIELKDCDKEFDHWNIGEEPFVICDHEIVDGVFSNPVHDLAVAGYAKFMRSISGDAARVSLTDKFLAWCGLGYY